MTPLAMPGPLLETVIVNPIGSPADTEPASATFSMSIEAPRTITSSVSSSVPSLVVVTDAVLETGLSGTVSLVVGLAMWTVRTWPEARSPRAQVRTPASMAQLRGGRAAVDRPAGAGVGREGVVDDARPSPTPGPLLVTVIVKPIGSPADTEPASATFVMSIEAHRTLIEPVSVLLVRSPDASFVDDAVAELLSGAQNVVPARSAVTV